MKSQKTGNKYQVAIAWCSRFFYAGQFCIAVGGVPSDENAYLLTKLNEPLTLEFGASVFIKLPHSYTGKGETLTVIAQGVT